MISNNKRVLYTTVQGMAGAAPMRPADYLGIPLTYRVVVSADKDASDPLFSFLVEYTAVMEGPSAVWNNRVIFSQEHLGFLGGGNAAFFVWLTKVPSPSELHRWFHETKHDGENEPRGFHLV